MTPRNAPFPRKRQLRPVIVAPLVPYAVVASAFLYVALSTHLLVLLHWHYVGGGPGFEKIHPATYLLCASIAAAAVVDQTFRQQLVSRLISDLSLVLFALAIVATATYALLVRGASVAPFVDSLGGAVLAAAALTCLPRRPIILLRLAIDLFFLINVVLIFWEFIVHRDVFSQYALNFIRTPEEFAILGSQGQDTNYGRMSALFGNPLTAALMFGIYTIASLVSTRLSYSPGSVVRLGLVGLSYFAIFPTGSRASMAAATLIITLYVLQTIFSSAIRGYVNSAGLFLSVLAVIGFVFGATLLWNAGFFDQIIERFQFDYGSASTRTEALELLEQATPAQLWFGMDQADLYNIQIGLGLIAIEISWVNFVLVGGLITALPLFITFCLFSFRSLRRYCDFGIYFVSLLIFESTLASNSIWAKTTAFAAGVTIAISFLRKGLNVNSRRIGSPATRAGMPIQSIKQVAGMRS